VFNSAQLSLRQPFSARNITPVILEPEHWSEWLQAGTPGARELLQSARDGVLDIYPVSTKVNNPQYSLHDCNARFEDSEERTELFRDQ